MPTKSDGSADTQPTNDRLDPALLRIAGIVLLGAVAALLDTTVVSVALDQLGEAFSAPVSTVQWVSTAYLLAMALVIPLTGWCVDRYGSRRTWLAVLALFLAGSVLCSVAWSAPRLGAATAVHSTVADRDGRRHPDLAADRAHQAARSRHAL